MCCVQQCQVDLFSQDGTLYGPSTVSGTCETHSFVRSGFFFFWVILPKKRLSEHKIIIFKFVEESQVLLSHNKIK